MASYRIVQRPSYLLPTEAIFVVEQRHWTWWEHMGLCISLEEAERRVAELQEAARNPVETKTVKEYN